jgi:hypothetical protein
MKFFRRTVGYSLFYHKGNEEVSEEFKVEPVAEKLRRYKLNWLRNVTSVNNNRTPKIMLNYTPDGRRRPARLWKRLPDETETGRSRPNS